MDQRRLDRIRSLPIAALDLMPRTMRDLVERLGGTRETSREFYTVGDVMAAVEARRGFTPFEASEFSYVLRIFKERLLREGLTYLDWKYLPPSTVTALLPDLPKNRILKLDARVLDSFSNPALLHVARELGRQTYGQVVIPDDVTVADLIGSSRFVDFARIGRIPPEDFAKTAGMLRSLGFRPRDGLLLKVAA